MIYIITEVTGKRADKVARPIAATTNLQVAEAHKASLEASFAALPAAAAQVKTGFDRWLERNPAPPPAVRPARLTPQERAAARGDTAKTPEERQAERLAERQAAKAAAKEALNAKKIWTRRAQNRVDALCDNLGIERLDWQVVAGATPNIDQRRYIIKEVPEL